MKVKRENALFYCLALFIGILLLYWFRNVPDNVLKWLLYPYAKVVEAFYNISTTYISELGYASKNMAFIIGRKCMGHNFIVMLFLMNSCMFAEYFKGISKILWLLASLAGAVFIGVITGCIRIIGSIPFVAHDKFVVIHSGMGIALYFFVLASCYVMINHFFRRGHIEENM